MLARRTEGGAAMLSHQEMMLMLAIEARFRPPAPPPPERRGSRLAQLGRRLLRRRQPTGPRLSLRPARPVCQNPIKEEM